MRKTSAVPAADRIRRQWMWLGGAAVVHAAVLAAVIAVAASGRTGVAGTAIVTFLALGAPAVGLWLEQRDPVRRSPDRWRQRSIGILVPQAGAVFLAAAVFQPGWLPRLAIALGVAVVQFGCVGLAARALRYPLSPELGEMDIDVAVRIRAGEVVPGWALRHELRLNDREIIIMVQSGPAALHARRIAFAEVIEVTGRQAKPKDGPWMRLDNGRHYIAMPGDVVAIRSRNEHVAVPVCDGEVVAELIRTRVAKSLLQP